MNVNKLISTFKTVIFIILIMASTNSMAGYMVYYDSDPFMPCGSCHTPHYRYHRCSHKHYYRHYYKHRHYSRSRSHYRITVYYTWVPYPDYSCCHPTCCHACAPCASRCQTCDQDNFYPRPAREVNPCSSCYQGRSYDTSTADDNYEY
jgi:hypothetical protein